MTPEQRDHRRNLRYQLDSARLLTQLVEQAFHHDLPLLEWHLTTVGLVGRHDSLSATPAQRQAAFEAWAAHLGAQVDPPVDRDYPTPTRVLRAETRVPHPQAITGTVRVVLFAEIDLEEEAEL